MLDLSCRQRDGQYWVVTDRWQKFSSLSLSEATLASLANSCDEFLVHGVDVEGMQLGIDDKLVQLLGEWSRIPVTYAGGARTLVSRECRGLGKQLLVVGGTAALVCDHGGGTVYLGLDTQSACCQQQLPQQYSLQTDGSGDGAAYLAQSQFPLHVLSSVHPTMLPLLLLLAPACLLSLPHSLIWSVLLLLARGVSTSQWAVHWTFSGASWHMRMSCSGTSSSSRL